MKKIAIIGAGPIGIEAALLATSKGFEVTVYERGDVGDHVESWGHVRLFSPWSLNRSPWGKKALDGLTVDEDAFPTGDEFLETYLRPLAALLPKGTIVPRTEVVSVSRERALKGDFIGNPERASNPFRIHLFHEDETESFVHADYVFDASGVLDIPNGLGRGGLPALNDWKYEDRICRYVPDFDIEGEAFAGKRVLVMGDGYSAITSLRGLLALKGETPATTIHWGFLKETPYELIENDSLPQRAELAELGNALATKSKDGVNPYPGTTVLKIEDADDGSMRVTLEQDDSTVEVDVDVIVANVGFSPNLEITRELQVHLCYASEGPMKLAATLLAASGADCLATPAAGIDTLKSPEPDFFVLGGKSYGRNSSFLLRAGFEQIEAVLDDIA